MLAPLIRRTSRVRHEVKRREVEVTQVEPVTKNVTAVTFGGASLADFSSLSFDDHVKFNFENGTDELARRDYTPRRFDRMRNELTIEYFLHDGGEASAWAQQVRPGAKAIIGGPKSSMIIPADYDWHLLVGDATALPAIDRRLEELPPHVHALAVIHVDDQADRRQFQCKAQLEVRWASSSSELVGLLRKRSVNATDSFVWCAGEASVMAQLRDILLVEKHYPRESARIAAYWRRDGGAGHEVLV